MSARLRRGHRPAWRSRQTPEGSPEQAELQELFSHLSESVSNLMLFLARYYSPSRLSWNRESLAGKSKNETDEIKKCRFYVWHESHDLPEELYRERYTIMCTELPSLCQRVLSAYKKFRKKIKNK